MEGKYFMQLSSNVKKIIIGITSLVIVAGGIGIYFYVKNNLVFQSSGKVTVLSIPFTITVTDNGWERPINTEPLEGVTVPFHSGTRNISFSAEGFETENREISVEEGSEQVAYVILTPTTKEAEVEVQNDEKYNQRREDITGFMIESGGKKLEEEYPIVNKLPIFNKWYRMNLCSGEDEPALELNEYGICVDLALDNAVQRENIINDIRDTGEDPAQYKIVINGKIYKE